MPIAIEDLTTEQQATFRSEIGALKADQASVLALLQTAILAAQRLTLGVDDNDSANTITLRRFREADGTELPKTRIVVDRGASADSINQDYLSLLFTQNLNWDTDLPDDATLPTSRLGLEYQYNDGLNEFNWDNRTGAGVVIDRTFHIEQPTDGSRGNGQINNNMGFPSVQISSEYLSYSLTTASRILLYGNPGSDNMRVRIESTNTSHNSSGVYLKGNATAGASAWGMFIDRFRNGSKDLFFTDELTAETAVLTLKFGTKVAEFGGDVEVTDLSKGVVIKSPNGNRWRLTVSNAGAVSATAL